MCWIIKNVKKSTFLSYLQTWSEETFYYLIEVFQLCVLLFEFKPSVFDNYLFNTKNNSKKCLNTAALSNANFKSLNLEIDFFNNINLCFDCLKNKSQNTQYSNISKSFSGNEHEMSNFKFYKKTPHCIGCARKLFNYKNEHFSVCWRSTEQLLSSSFEKKNTIKSLHIILNLFKFFLESEEINYLFKRQLSTEIISCILSSFEIIVELFEISSLNSLRLILPNLIFLMVIFCLFLILF